MAGINSKIIKTTAHKNKLLELLNIKDINKLKLLFRQVGNADWREDFENKVKNIPDVIVLLKVKGE